MEFQPENIPQVAQRFGNSGELPSFCSNTLACPLSGGRCQVYKLEFSDKTTWAVRVPIHSKNQVPKDLITAQLQGEVKFLKLLNVKGFKWAPKYIGHDLSFDNEVCFPFIIVSWVPGDPLEWNDNAPLNRGDRDKVLQQVIEIILQLIQCTKVERESTLDFLTDFVDGKLVRAYRNQVPGVSVEDSLVLRAILPQAVHNQLDHAPFFVSHRNISSNNILVDSNHNITGLIDWSCATYRPFQIAAGLPRFLETEEQDNLIPSKVAQQDRRSLLTHLNQCTSEYAPLLALMYSADDLDYRHLVLEAALSKESHKWLTDHQWFNNRAATLVNHKVLEREMDAFLSGRVNLGERLTMEQVSQCIA